MLSNGLGFKKLASSGSVGATLASNGLNTSKQWATSLVVQLWEVICWDLWDHRNQVKRNIETADIACCDAIMLALCSEYAFGRAGLPCRDWRLFKRPLLSTLSCLVTHPGPKCTLTESQTRRRRSQSNTAEGNLPKMTGPPPYPPAIPVSCRPTLDLLILLAPSCSHLGISPQGTSSHPVLFGIDRF